MRFRILPKIDDFTDALGNIYHPGDTVELPEELYLGLPWLEPVEEKPIEIQAKATTPDGDIPPIPIESVEDAPQERRRAKRNA